MLLKVQQARVIEQVSRIVLDICKILLFLVWINHVGSLEHIFVTHAFQFPAQVPLFKVLACCWPPWLITSVLPLPGLLHLSVIHRFSLIHVMLLNVA
jgi:hypothetical protein